MENKILKIHIPVRNNGEAMDLLSDIRLQLNNGQNHGRGWKIGEGKIEPEKIKGLDEAAKEFNILVTKGDNEEDIKAAWNDGVFERLSDVLQTAGYGVLSEEDMKQIEEEKKEPSTVSEEKKDGEENAPWNKKKQQ